MSQYNRRKHDRLPLRLNLVCHRTGSDKGVVFAGRTVNVSTGGVFFEACHAELIENDLLHLQFSVPPAEGTLKFGGQMNTLARVVRVDKARSTMALEPGTLPRITVAAEFLNSLKLWA